MSSAGSSVTVTAASSTGPRQRSAAVRSSPYPVPFFLFKEIELSPTLGIGNTAEAAQYNDEKDLPRVFSFPHYANINS
jgi:hypothetical protein